MFSVQVSTYFDAVHAVTVCGVEETPHNHTWGVEVLIVGETLDKDGLLIDFVSVEKCLNTIIEPLRGADLNIIDIFSGKNPSAENVAFYICKEIIDKIKPPARVQSVTITEAPNCQAIYTL